MTFLSSRLLFPVKNFLQVNSMTAVITGELSAVCILLRGLCLRKTCLADVVRVRQRNVSAICLQSKTLLSTNSRTFAITSFCANSSNVLHLDEGPYLQQRRTYAKGPTPQKKILSFNYSGDLTTQQPLNPQDVHTSFQEVPYLDNVPESVKQLCSIDFAKGSDKKVHRKEEMKERIVKLFGTEADKEMHVALLTVDIRNMIPHVLNQRKDKLCKSTLVEKIQLRKKMLKQLRRTDYQRFLWLLQELRIRYVLPPDYYGHVTRRYKRKQEVWQAANNLRLKKIAELKSQLEAEKDDFLRYKEEALRQIHEDAQRYDLDLQPFEEKLKRKRIGKTYPRIYTWEERQLMEQEAAKK